MILTCRCQERLGIDGIVIEFVNGGFDGGGRDHKRHFHIHHDLWGDKERKLGFLVSVLMTMKVIFSSSYECRTGCAWCHHFTCAHHTMKKWGKVGAFTGRDSAICIDRRWAQGQPRDTFSPQNAKRLFSLGCPPLLTHLSNVAYLSSTWSISPINA